MGSLLHSLKQLLLLSNLCAPQKWTCVIMQCVLACFGSETAYTAGLQDAENGGADVPGGPVRSMPAYLDWHAVTHQSGALSPCVGLHGPKIPSIS